MVSKNVLHLFGKITENVLKYSPPQEKSESAHEMAFNLFSVDAFQLHARVFHQNSIKKTHKSMASFLLVDTYRL